MATNAEKLGKTLLRRQANKERSLSHCSEIRPEVYRSLLDLTAHSSLAIASLYPRENIDTQRFIFVIGGYADVDKAGV